MGRNQYWAGRVYYLCVYYMTGTPEGSTESGFMEKPGIEPATIFSVTNITILSIFRTHAQKEYNKVLERKGIYILNNLVLLLFENLSWIY